MTNETKPDPDKEIADLRAMAELLEGHDDQTRRRMLRWLCARYWPPVTDEPRERSRRRRDWRCVNV